MNAKQARASRKPSPARRSSSGRARQRRPAGPSLPERRYHRLIDLTPDAIGIHRGAVIQYVNAAAVRLLGAARPGDLIGRPLVDLVHPDHRDDILQRVSTGSEESRLPLTAETRLMRLDGRIFDAEILSAPVLYRNEPATQTLIRDITARKQEHKVQAAVYAISEAAHTVSRLEDLLPAIHAIIGELMPADNFYIALHDAASGLIHFPYAVDTQETEPWTPHRPRRGLTEYVLRTGRPLLAPPDVFDALVLSGEVELIGAPSIDWLGVPLTTGDTTIGVLAMQTYIEGVRYTEEHVRILSFVSTQIAMVIERKRTEEALRESERQHRELFAEARRQARELALLDRVRSVLARELDLSILMRAVVEATAETFGYTQVSLYLLDGEVLRLQHQIGYAQTIAEIPIDRGVSGRVVRLGRPVLIEDARSEPEFIGAIASVTSEVCVPLIDQGRVAGTLNVESTGGVKLTQADLRLMTALSEHVGIAFERARLYTELRDSGARLHTAVESLPFSFWMRDETDRFIMQNAASTRQWGNMIGLRLEELNLADDRLENWRETSRRAFLGEVVREEEEITLDSGKRYHYKTIAPVRDGDRIRGILGITLDITDRRRAEEALRRSEERYRAFIAHSTEGIWRFEIEPPVAVDLPEDEQIERWYSGVRLAECNDAMARMYGYERAEDFVGVRMSDILIQSDPLNAESLRQFIRSKYRMVDLESHERDVQGGDKYFLNNLVGIVEEGRLVRMWGTRRDITDRRRAEEALRRTQKMESLGVLAGGVAHDFNNLLTAMLAQTSLALAKLPPDQPARPHIEKAVTAAERASDLTRQLLAYSGRGQFIIEALNLNALLQENLHLFEIAVPKHVQLRSQPAQGLPPIRADAGQMQQVIMNLILNAAEAIGDRPGTVIAATRVQEVRVDDHRFWQYTGEPLPPDRYVALEVRDNGSGMNAETLSRIFDPFFTTKFTGRGLGLAAVLGIVRGHHGGLSVESEIGKGTTFTLLFPASSAAQDAVSDRIGDGEPPSMRGTVLVIDDEAPIRQAVADILEIEGLETLAAASGAEGVALYRKRRAGISLVLLDLSMPGLSGEETFRELKAIDPDVEVVLSSGYSQAEAIRRFDGLGITGFLQKPYDTQTFLQVVRRHMRSTP